MLKVLGSSDAIPTNMELNCSIVTMGFSNVYDKQEKEVGRYQIAVSKGARTQLYRVDTKTGEIVEVNERKLKLVDN